MPNSESYQYVIYHVFPLTTYLCPVRTAFGPLKYHLNTVVHGYYGCSCGCYAAALVLLLCMCYCYAVLLLLLLLCLRYVFAADLREHGYYASHPLLVMCLRILKLKY